MKQVLSFFLVITFLFGLIGYYGVFWVLSEKANIEMTNRLDEDRYDNEETITIKFPLTLAYPINSSQFERVDGSFEYNGEFYKLVKQKLEQDTLYVVCIRDGEKKRLNSLLTDMVKIANHQPVNSSAIKLLCSYAKDFVVSLNLEIKNTPDKSGNNFYSVDADVLVNSYPVINPPPEEIL